MQVSEIISSILKNGIRKYKFKNSKVRPFISKPEGSKGAVFGFRSKENMIASRGVVLTSEEGLAENEDCFTHWTPNVYSYGTYADDGRTIVKGHAEQNLKQINAFVIDFDRLPGEKLNYQMILDAAIDLEWIPTLILKTPRGYQAYFILDNPWYISKKNNYQSIEVAKRVSENLRKAFTETLPSVDLGCNHFGIARMPRNDNIVYFYPTMTLDMQQLIRWSMKYQPSRTYRKSKLALLKGKEIRQVDEKWVHMLLNNPKIVGTKGKLGPNSGIYTLSLAYYASGIDQDDCFNVMDEFNSNLKMPLRNQDVVRTVKSAYSGRFPGANKEKVLLLLENWGLEPLSEDQLFTQKFNGWHKFKKDRSERKQSHIHEWKKDILEYLDTQSYRYRPEIQLTKSELQSVITYRDKSIPKRSLDIALKELKAEGKLYLKVKSGRGGGIIVATRKALIRTVLIVKREVREAYKNAIRTFFEEADMLIKMVKNDVETSQNGRFKEPISLWNTS